jgi:multimeric flavodoxin WrbA
MILKRFNTNLPKVVLIQGSPRDPDTCPGMESKTHIVIQYIIDKFGSDFDFQVIDLSVNQNKKSIIQPCKGCISTAGGYHCHFPCSCYKPNDDVKPDLMYDDNIYEKLEESSAFIIFSPVHWYSLTSQVKALFDRLVCINQTLTKDEAIKLMGNDFKNPLVTGKYSQSGKLNGKLKNHWLGKIAGFYVHGDDGANDYQNKNYPDSYKYMWDQFTDPSMVINPFVMQLKYSGIYVPDNLQQSFYVNKGVDYYTANIGMNPLFFEKADELIENLKNIL